MCFLGEERGDRECMTEMRGMRGMGEQRAERDDIDRWSVDSTMI
jgi:hypothetical protein